MYSTVEIIETVQYDINLHDKLCEIVNDMHHCVKEESFDYFAEKDRKRAKLEREIEHTNKSIVKLFSRYHADEESKEEISRLMNMLRESIKKAMTIIEGTVAAVEQEKDKTASQLSTFGENRKAINCYINYGTM